MSVSIFQLTEREWVQVRAALMFWRCVAESCRQHPSRHPKVEPIFEGYAPLMNTEIDELLAGTPEKLYIGAKAIAKATGRAERTVQWRLTKEGIIPALIHGPARLYRIDQVTDLMERISAEVTHRRS